MLDAAVSGSIFASPNAVRAGLQHVESPKGSLIIVKNYTGDRLNFGIATENARAYDGLDVELVSVQDDVSVPRSRSGLVGRRGLAGVVLVHKVAGASAAEGASLAQVTANERSVADHIDTIGMSLNGCSIPGVHEGRKVAPWEMELGMRIHNEPGTRKIPSNTIISSLIGTMLSAILDQNDEQSGYLKWDKESQFVLLINNLGGLSKLELLSITEHVLLSLRGEYSINPRRMFSGTYISSLDGLGFNITLLALSGGSDGDNILKLLDAPTECVDWPPPRPILAKSDVNSLELNGRHLREGEKKYTSLRTLIPYNYTLFRGIIENVHTSLVSAEPEITRFDTYLGDGDCGTTLLAGSSGLVNDFSSKAEYGSDLIADMQRLTDTLGTQMSGTSGALYPIFFSGFVSGIQQQFKERPNEELSLPIFSKAFAHGLDILRRYTSAGVGDRTMMDALIPLVEALQQKTSGDLLATLSEASDAARKGCDNTRRQQSHYGRSTYVGAASDVELEADSMPDPGACGVVAVAQGILEAI